MLDSTGGQLQSLSEQDRKRLQYTCTDSDNGDVEKTVQIGGVIVSSSEDRAVLAVSSVVHLIWLSSTHSRPHTHIYSLHTSEYATGQRPRLRAAVSSASSQHRHYVRGQSPAEPASSASAATRALTPAAAETPQPAVRAPAGGAGAALVQTVCAAGTAGAADGACAGGERA